jgi:hypothetical protein
VATEGADTCIRGVALPGLSGASPPAPAMEVPEPDPGLFDTLVWRFEVVLLVWFHLGLAFPLLSRRLFVLRFSFVADIIRSFLALCCLALHQPLPSD